MPCKLHKQFVEGVKRGRDAQNLTQKDLAGILDVRRPYVADLERGRNAPGVELVERVLAALGYNVELKITRQRKKKSR